MKDQGRAMTIQERRLEHIQKLSKEIKKNG